MAQKVVINADAGIDAGIALLAALRCRSLEVLGIVTSFGAGSLQDSTENASRLRALAQRLDVPIISGAATALKGPCSAPSPAHYANGRDCLGDLPAALLPPADKSAAEAAAPPQAAAHFICDTAARHPGEVALLQMGPLTNLAEAIRRDAAVCQHLAGVWVAGGSFYSTGDVNAAAEFSVLADPEAADAVFTSGVRATVLGLNVTAHVVLSAADIQRLEAAGGAVAAAAGAMARHLQRWFSASESLQGVRLRGACALACLLDPSLLTTKAGAVRVETEGIARGHTIMDFSLNNWYNPNPWVGQPEADVGILLDGASVCRMAESLLTQPA